jgi:hypothetical protein
MVNWIGVAIAYGKGKLIYKRRFRQQPAGQARQHKQHGDTGGPRQTGRSIRGSCSKRAIC